MLHNDGQNLSIIQPTPHLIVETLHKSDTYYCPLLQVLKTNRLHLTNNVIM
ncbi:hypothetical protein ViNHUV68_40460 [Vibrio sp. NH-UV-68]